MFFRVKNKEKKKKVRTPTEKEDVLLMFIFSVVAALLIYDIRWLMCVQYIGRK
jgi:hypothetical protein